MNSKATLPLYLTATATSLFGNAAIAIVLPWLVLERTGNPALAATVAAVSALPAAISAFVGGHLIDKVGRRRMSVLADLGSAASVAGLAIVDAAVGLDAFWFIALGILGALFDVPGMTARETLLANVSETSGVTLDRIAALRGMIFGLSFLAGPALAGWLLTMLDSVDVIWITAGCSLAAAVLIGLMPLVPSALAPSEDTSVLAGFTLVFGTPALKAMLIISLASMVVVGPLLAIILPAHFTALASPGQLGLTLSAYAVGSMVGSGLYGLLFGNRRWAAWVVSNLLYAVGGVLVATLDGFWLVAVGMTVAGIASGLMQPLTTVVMTERIPDALRGRVFGAYSAASMMANPVGLGLMALILSAGTLQTGAWAMALGWAIVSAYAIVAPSLRGYVEAAPEPEKEPDADHQTAG
ncbi:MAG: MFS transporter [Propioniciclava sp.]|uniref:MFS transporter n=1 Tax=Propioniciclava sp. TaxID=2038686 RepID=UPI0039E55DF9